MPTEKKPKPLPVVFRDDIWTSNDPRENEQRGRSYKLVDKVSRNGKVDVSDPITKRKILPIQLKRFVLNSMGYKLVVRVGDVWKSKEGEFRYEGRRNATQAWVQRLDADDAPRSPIDYADLLKLTLISRGTGKVE